jgi:hypothetical protein
MTVDKVGFWSGLAAFVAVLAYDVCSGSADSGLFRPVG